MFGFASCSSEDDDDDFNIITGSGNDYTASYTNDTDSNARGYDTTQAKHRGALIQLTFDKNSLSANGAMAFIWDLESNSGRSVKDPRVFNIAGLRIVTDSGKYYAQPMYQFIKIFLISRK